MCNLSYIRTFFLSSLASSFVLVATPDLSVLWDVLISFAVSFMTILGSKLINYLGKKLDNSIDLNSKLTDDNENSSSDKRDESRKDK